MKSLILGCIAVIFTFLSGEVDAGGVLIGPFWMEGKGITSKENPNDTIEESNGKWTRIDYKYTGGRGTFTVFERPVSVDGLPTRARVLQAAKNAGIKIVIDGSLKDMKISGYVFDSPAGRELTIEYSNLNVTLGKVTSGFQRIAGGTIDLKGSLAWITLPTEFRATGDRVEGTFQIEMWKRRLNQAKIVFSGGAETTATFTPERSNENVTLRVDMSTGRASLWEASMSSYNVRLSGNALDVGPATFSDPRMQVKQMNLIAIKGQLSTTLSNVTGDTQKVHMPSETLSFEAQDSKLSWATGQAPGTHTIESATFEGMSVAGGLVVANNGRLFTADHTALSGAVSASNLTLSSSSLRGTFDWARPDVSFLSFLVSRGEVNHLMFKLDGKWGNPFVISGAMDSGSVNLGGFTFIRPLRLAFSPTLTSQDIPIPILIDVPSQGGQLQVTDGTNIVIITAELQRLYMKAILTLSVPNFQASRLDVQPGDLKFDFDTAVSTSPWLGSTKPLFAAASLNALNHSALAVSLNEKKGLILVDTDIVAIGDPVLQVGDAKPFFARTNLNATAGATFAYCLNRNDFTVTKGTFTASDTVFKSLEANAAINIGPIFLFDPDGTIQDLSISIDRAKNEGMVSSNSIQLTGTRLAIPKKTPSEMALDGQLGNGLVISRIEGTPEFTPKQINLTDLRAYGVSFGINNASFEVGQAVRLTESSVSITGDEVRSVLELKASDSDTPVPYKPKYLQISSLEEVCNPLPSDDEADTTTRQYLTNTRFDMKGNLHVGGQLNENVKAHLTNAPTLSANIGVSGRSDRLSGGGAGSLSPFIGDLDSAIYAEADCTENPGAKLRIPMKTGLATGGTTLDITIDRGKAEAKGRLAGFGLLMTSTGTAECHGKWMKEVLVPASSGWTEGICPTWSEPFRNCRWEWSTPEVSYEYRTKTVVRSLQAGLFLPVPFVRLADEKELICNVGPPQIGPVLFLGGYYPEFRGSVPIVSDVANALIGSVAESVESTIATFITNSIAGMATITFVDPVAGSASCILLGVWN